MARSRSTTRRRAARRPGRPSVPSSVGCSSSSSRWGGSSSARWPAAWSAGRPRVASTGGFVKEVGEDLPAGGSALFLQIKGGGTDVLVGALSQYKGRVRQTFARRRRGVRPGRVAPLTLRPSRRGTVRRVAAPEPPSSVGDARPDDPGLVGEHDGLDAVAEVELVENVRDVGLRRVLADEELGGDLGVRQAARDERAGPRRSRGVSRSSPAGGAGVGRRRANSLDQPPGDRGAKSESPAADDADRGDQMRRAARP